MTYLKRFVYLVGFTQVGSNVYNVANQLYTEEVAQRQNHLQKYGRDSWVLVTGSTDGIGRSIADNFAA